MLNEADLEVLIHPNQPIDDRSTIGFLNETCVRFVSKTHEDEIRLDSFPTG